MAITLTKEEMELVRAGTLDPNNIMEHREHFPIRSIDVNEVEQIKQEIRQANIEYKEAIDKNKELYDMLTENRKRKEDCRNKIAELRTKKKQLLGLIE